LFLRRALRRLASEVVGREGLGEHAIGAVSPTAVMFDDLIGDLAHVSLLYQYKSKFAGRSSLEYKSCFLPAASGGLPGRNRL
jgi:hypothetical protein